MTQTEAPERIWAHLEPEDVGGWYIEFLSEEPWPGDDPGVEYIRADIAEAPHTPAAFINAIREEGTKEEACDYLQKQWNENCALRAKLAAAREVAELEWVENPLREYWYSAEGAGVKYDVKEIGLGKWWLSIDGDMRLVPFDYADVAKASARGHHKRRILAALKEV